MGKIYWALLLVLFISCGEQEKKATNLKEQFDAIDKITGVDNWKLIDGADTSCLYFSRIAEQRINVYHFNIVKGDSANTQLNSIEAKNDSVFWNWTGKQWYLVSAKDSIMEWADKTADNNHYTFKRKDKMHISYTLPGGHIVELSRTLPLATFLVRSKYDYEHGTSYIDSSEVPPRAKIK
jgi:hypothetical protein